jgi:hypothetical protein
MVDDTVAISKAYLEELETKAKRVEDLEKAATKFNEKKKKGLESLLKYRAEHGTCKKSTERVKRYVELNREEYNARRRERYRLKKEAEKGKSHTDTS